ncbi:MAG: AhpC/TSA family protein [Chloroflexota bacterium]|nr:AhpC/TSA family protein [Chloroflexota bacterium]
MREEEAELTARGVRVFAVTFESAARVRDYRQREAAPYPILRDPKRAAYRAFGIERRGAASIWRPRTIWYYVKSALRGRWAGSDGADIYQLGGDVLLGPSGAVCWVYRSREPADRAGIDTIVKEIDACRAD